MPSILVVENNLAELLAVKRAFSEAGVANPLHTVRSSGEAKQYLKGEYPYCNRMDYPTPSVILLDTDEPAGFELLTWIRHRFPGGGLLLVVLMSLEEIRKISRAYSMGANSFLTKPVNVSELQELIDIFSGYWLVHRFPLIHEENFADPEMFAYDS
jgi:CheY-like chemotaxis protein